MKGVRIVLLGVAIGTITASPLWADQNKTVGEQMKGAAENAGQGIENGAEATGHAIEKGAEKTGKFLGITSSEAARFAANERAEHRVYGKITHVNHDSGAVAVKTTQAPLELQFPSHTVRRLHKGDRITVQLAYAVIAPANSASNAAEGRAPNAQHTSERAAKSAGPEITSLYEMPGLTAEQDYDRDNLAGDLGLVRRRSGFRWGESAAALGVPMRVGG